MARLELTLAMDDNARSHPVLSGRIVPEGITLRFPSRLRGPELFRHQLRHHEYDVSDMSLSSLFMMRDHGEDSFVALPVFTMRGFFHSGALVRDAARITGPADLSGRRIGVPDYSSAAAIWARGALRDEFGVDPMRCQWFETRHDPPGSDEIRFEPPAGLALRQAQAGGDLAAMLSSGELEAAVNFVPRDKTLLEGGSGVSYLFGDPLAESARYHQKTGLYPFNHCVVIKREVVDQHPWVVLNLYSAFLAANELSRAGLSGALVPYLDAGLIDSSVATSLQANLYGYGVASQRPILETFSRYCHEQGFTRRLVPPEEVFAPATLGL